MAKNSYGLEGNDLKTVLKNIAKNLDNKYIQYGAPNIGEAGIVDFGCPSVDYMLHHRAPQGRIWEISGAENAGKTLIATIACKSYKRNELKRNPEAPRAILYVDAEGTVDPEWLKLATGYDMNDAGVPTVYYPPQGEALEEIYSAIVAMVKTGEIGMVIFDSMTAVSTAHTAGQDMAQAEVMGGTAKVNAEFVRRYTGVFNRQRCTYIAINGSTTNIGGYGNPETTSGGTYWRRACSVRLRVKKGKYFDSEGNELSGNAENPAGNIIEIGLLKSKICKGDRRLSRIYLDYSKGIDVLQDTIDMAILFGIIDNSTQGSFILTNPSTGEVLLDENGKEIKIRGSKNVKPYFQEHPELFKAVYDKVYEIIDNEDLQTNTQTYDQMMGIENVADYFNVDFAKEESEEIDTRELSGVNLIKENSGEE